MNPRQKSELALYSFENIFRVSMVEDNFVAVDPQVMFMYQDLEAL